MTQDTKDAQQVIIVLQKHGIISEYSDIDNYLKIWEAAHEIVKLKETK
jgi:hypothetical protein